MSSIPEKNSFVAILLLFICTCCTKVKVNSSYERAKEFKESKQLDSALYYYQQAYIELTESNQWERALACQNKMGSIHFDKADYQTAKAIYEKALQVGQSNLPEDHLHLAVAYEGLGKALYSLSEYEEAEDHFYKAMEIRQARLDPDDILMADIYNDLGMLYLTLSQIAKGEDYLRKAFEIRKKSLGPTNEEVGKSYHGLGLAYQDRGYFLEAIAYYEEALKIFLELKDGALFASYPYNNIGGIYNLLGQYEKAYQYCSKAYKIRTDTLLNQNKGLIATACSNLGNVLFNMGEYDRSIAYYDEGLRIQKEIFGEKHFQVADLYGNKSIVLLHQEKFGAALDLDYKALKIRESTYGEYHPSVAISYNNIGNIYKATDQLDKAMNSYQKALMIRDSILEPDHPIYAPTYNNIGDVLKTRKDYARAADYYQKAISVYIQNFGDGYLESGIVYGNWSDIYFRKQEWEKSLSLLQKGIGCLAKHTDSDQIAANPKPEDVLDNRNLLKFLNTKAQILSQLYKETQDSSYLSLSLETDRVNIRIIEKALSILRSNENKLFLRAKVDSIYERALQSSLALNELSSPTKKYKEIANVVLEKSKAFQLVEHIKQVNALKFAQVPDALIDREQELQLKATFLTKELWQQQQKEKKLREVILSEPNVSLRDSLEEVRSGVLSEIDWKANFLFDTQKNLDDLFVELESNFPEYYLLKYDFEVPSAREIQQEIFASDFYGTETVIIQFLVGSDHIYAQVITADSIFFQSVEKPANFSELLTALKKGMEAKQFLNEPGTARAYLSAGYKLYQLLLEEVLAKIGDEIKRFVIIPDGVLHYAHFELFLQKPVGQTNLSRLDCSKLDYLLKDYTVSYAYSLRALMEANKTYLENKSRKKKYSFCGIEPIYGKRTTKNIGAEADSNFYQFVADSIPDLQNEVNELAPLFGRNALTVVDEEATESRFLEIVGENFYRILHLSAHGLINEDFPEYSKLILSFTDFKYPLFDDCIDVAELYNLHIPADLVVLSACKTGVGSKIYSGEGMISLARGFAFAGSPSIVMSMWDIEERANGFLMKAFYKNLLNRMPIDIALNEAKLAYLEDKNFGLYELIPSRWAAMVPIGLMRPVFN